VKVCEAGILHCGRLFSEFHVNNWQLLLNEF